MTHLHPLADSGVNHASKRAVMHGAANLSAVRLSAGGMRVFLCPLVLCVFAATALADVPPVSSERTQQALRDRLPRYNPAVSEAARKSAEERAQRRAAAAAAAAASAEPRIETTASGEEIVVLPEVQVRDRKLAQPHPDEWLGPQELQKKAMRAHAAKMSSLELALNRWHIPLVTPSFAARARADYEAQKRAEETQRLEHIESVGQLGDGKR